MRNQDEDGNMRDMTDQEINEEHARLLDEADEREAETDRRIAAHVMTMTLLDFSQELENMNRLNESPEMRGEFTIALVQLRVALSIKMSPEFESPEQKLILDALISESIVDLCETIWGQE